MRWAGVHDQDKNRWIPIATTKQNIFIPLPTTFTINSFFIFLIFYMEKTHF